jgi:hypothetical protein
VHVNSQFDNGLRAFQLGDHAVALMELAPLAEQGDARAQYNLGIMYTRGVGVPKSDQTALKWYIKAAEQGDALAQYDLG